MPKSSKASSKAPTKKTSKTSKAKTTSPKKSAPVKKVKLPRGVTVEETPASIRKDMSGQKYGRLTVLGFGGYRDERPTWKCLCECGNVRNYFRSNIHSGTSTQCIDCARAEHLTRSTSHGMWGTPEYRTWERVQKFEDIAPKWRKFVNFYKEVGPRPSEDHSLMRIRSDQGWNKANVDWVHQSKVGERRSSQLLVKHGNVTKPATEWAAELGITVQAFRQRLRSGKSIKEIMAMPTRKPRTTLKKIARAKTTKVASVKKTTPKKSAKQPKRK